MTSFEEDIDKANQGISLVEDDLRQALKKANPIEILIVSNLFEETVKLRQKIFALRSTFDW